MKTTTKPAKSPATAKPEPFAPGSLLLLKGRNVALRFSHIGDNGNVYARGAEHDEQDPATIHDLGNDLSRIIPIPETVTLPDGSTLHTQNRAELAALVRKADRHFRASAKAWEDDSNFAGSLTSAQRAALSKRHHDQADKGAALLAPLGISCDWPGLYPSFEVHGYGEHSTETAVLFAVGLPRNALRGELGKR